MYVFCFKKQVKLSQSRYTNIWQLILNVYNTNDVNDQSAKFHIKYFAKSNTDEYHQMTIISDVHKVSQSYFRDRNVVR